MNFPIERRRFPRVETKLPLKYKMIGKLRFCSMTYTKNISVGGAKFIVDRYINFADRIVVEITLAGQYTPVRVIAKVAWIQKMPYNDNYIIGGHFVDMSRKDKRILGQYIDGLIGNQFVEAGNYI